MPSVAARSRVRRYAAGERSGVEDRLDPGVGVVPLVLEHDSLAGVETERVEGAGVEPGVVGVAGDQDDRDVGCDLVEPGDGRLLGPHPGAMAPADQRPGVDGEPVAHPREGVVRRDRAGQVEPAGAGRPLREVDVVVPQARDRPAPLRVVLLDAGRPVERVPDLADGPLLDQDVDRTDPAAPPPQLDHSDTTEQEVGHGVTVVSPFSVVPDETVVKRAKWQPLRQGLPEIGAQTWRRDWTIRKREAT